MTTVLAFDPFKAIDDYTRNVLDIRAGRKKVHYSPCSDCGWDTVDDRWAEAMMPPLYCPSCQELRDLRAERLARESASRNRGGIFRRRRQCRG